MYRPLSGGSLRLPNSQPSDEDLRARRCSAIRTSSRCSFSMTASCASSLPTRPAATPAAYCAVTVLAICDLTVVGETWREPPPFPPPLAGEGRVGALHCACQDCAVKLS